MAFVTNTENRNVPPLVGVPLISPLLFSESPGGSAPETIEPPVAPVGCEYEEPSRPGGSASVGMLETVMEVGSALKVDPSICGPT